MKDLIETIIEVISQVLGDVYRFIFEELLSNKNHALSASFGDEGELLGKQNKGFRIATKSLTTKASYENLLLEAPTGAGKSSRIIIPTVLNMDASMFILDPSREILDRCGTALKNKGFKIKVLDFSDVSRSSKYNILANADSVSKINTIADCLVNATLGTQSKDPFWSISSKQLISLLIQILKTQPKKYQNLYNLRNLLFEMKANPEKVDLLFARFAPNKTILNNYKSYISYDNKLLTSVIASCIAVFQLLSDDDIARITSDHTLNFEDMRKEKIATFVVTGVSRMTYLAPLVSLFFYDVFEYTMRRIPQKDEHDIFFIIDEAGLLKIPGSLMATTCSNIRKYRGGLLMSFQKSLTQCTENYGRENARTIIANCRTKVFLGGGMDFQTAQELSGILGRYEYQDEKEIKRNRDLLTSSELRELSPDTAIILNTHHKAIKFRLTPYYKQRKLKELTELPCLEIPKSEDCDEIPLLDLDNLPKKYEKA